MAANQEVSFWDKFWGAIVAVAVAIQNFILDWVDHNHGLKELCFGLLDALITVSWGAVIGSTLTYFTRKFWFWYDKRKRDETRGI